MPEDRLPEPPSLAPSEILPTRSLRIPGGPAEGQECTSMSFPFSTMLGASHGNHITTWAVSQVGLEEVFQTVLAGPKEEHGPDKHRLTSSITLLFFTIRSSSHRSPIQNHDYRCEYPSPWVPFESWK